MTLRACLLITMSLSTRSPPPALPNPWGHTNAATLMIAIVVWFAVIFVRLAWLFTSCRFLLDVQNASGRRYPSWPWRSRVCQTHGSYMFASSWLTGGW